MDRLPDIKAVTLIEAIRIYRSGGNHFMKKQSGAKTMPRKPVKMGTYAFQWPEPGGKTIAEGQRRMQEILLHEEEGGSCPCCGRSCLAYKVLLSKELITLLWHLVNRYLETRDWIDLDYFSAARKKVDPRTLNYWGLAVFRIEGKGKSKKIQGKPTKEGYDFIKEKIQVPTHTFIFANKVFAFSESVTGPREIIGVLEWHKLTKTQPKKLVLKNGEGGTD